jgi:hypothetical protein
MYWSCPNRDGLFLPRFSNNTTGTLGARLFAKGGQARRVAWMVLAGPDFPAAVEDMIRSWEVCFRLQRLPTQVSTRGLLKYKDSTFGGKPRSSTTIWAVN